MKKFFLLIGTLLFVFGALQIGTLEVAANSLPQSQKVKLMIEGKYEEPDVPAKITKGRTFVPLRFIAEKMGARVEWYPKTSTIEIQQDQRKIVMKLGSDLVKVNTAQFKMDVAPFAEQGRTLVPIRFVSEHLGLNVDWQATDRLVKISKPFSLTLNGQAFQKPYLPVRANSKIYVPIFEVANKLKISVQMTENSVVFSGEALVDKTKLEIQPTDSQNNTINIGKTELSIQEVVSFDGVQMVPFELVDSLLGTRSVYDPVKNEIKIQSQALETPKVELKELKSIQLKDGIFSLDLTTLNKTDYKHFFLENPHRLVVDLSNTILGDSLKPSQGAETILPLAQDTVKQIRVAQTSPNTVRIVFDLNAKSKVKLSEVNNQLQLKIQLKRTLVVIDAGHGGKDPGAVGKLTTEAKIVLDISLKIIALLEADPDIDVIATRRDDTFPTLDERVKLANNEQADIFLSVHANSVEKRPTVGGTETFIYLNSDKTFGSIIHKHLIEATKLKDRGLKEGNLKVLRETKMVAALIEIGFMSNPDEEKIMMESAFQERVALAMYNAIKEYVGK